MNIRILFIFIIAAVAVSGIGLYKKFSFSSVDDRRICIFSTKAPGSKDDVRFIRQALQLYDIKNNQITENTNCDNASIKILL